jgi:hypothetical protein
VRIIFEIKNMPKLLAALNAANSWAMDEGGWALAESEGVFWAGDLAVTMGPSLNRNQRLTIDIDRELLTYIGERPPFIEDGHLALIIAVADCLGPIVQYQTSDQSLAWYETRSRWVSSTAERWIKKASQLKL